MPDDVVDSVDGFAGRPCERLGAGDADGKASGEAGACGDGDGVDVGQVESALLTTGVKAWAWAREAISGMTPP